MKKIDISKWKEFQIDTLFTVSRPASRSVKKYYDGNVPFVSSGNFNNGIDSYKKPLENENLDKGNCITVSPVDGSAFYQEVDFLGRGGGGSSIILLYNDNLNKLNGLFLASVINKTLKRLYEYNDMGSSESIKKEKIKLPIKQDGTPDWVYMENFIKCLYSRESACTSLVSTYLEQFIKIKIDTTKWKEFIVGDLFKRIIKPNVLHSREVVEDANGIPYVVRTKFNNGIKYRVRKNKYMELSPKGVISFGAENA